ncbi:hypothetical protein D7Y05_08190 [bacterium 1XD42-54]|nr:hypothetical protein D7Y05_08190 [bacterium 1XD42-54]
MEDCRVEIAVRDGKVDMRAEHVSLEDMTAICGVLQVMVGRNAMMRGADLEMVKDKLLDVYLAAMNDLERQEGENE